MAYTYLLYTAYLVQTYNKFQLHLHNFNVGMPQTVLSQDFQ